MRYNLQGFYHLIIPANYIEGRVFQSVSSTTLGQDLDRCTSMRFLLSVFLIFVALTGCEPIEGYSDYYIWEQMFSD